MRKQPTGPVKKSRRGMARVRALMANLRGSHSFRRWARTGDERVAVIVPALNEGQRIATVLQAVTQARLVDEVIVVSDGSRDNTAEVARTFDRVKVIELPRNLGKGGAMFEGVRHTGADILVFIDADLSGLRPEQVTALVKPVLQEGAAMAIGLFRGGRMITDLSQKLVPFVSGQRAVRRDVFLTVPAVKSARMGVEVALTTHANVNRFHVEKVFLDGVTHPTKEEKLGLVRGLVGRLSMYKEIVTYYTREKVLHRRDRVVRWLNTNGQRLNAHGRRRLARRRKSRRDDFSNGDGSLN